MFRKIILACTVALLLCNSLLAIMYMPSKADSANLPLRISILTCGAGAELYSSWGHSAVRIIDSTAQTDEVVNYGMFDFADPRFYWKYIKGTLLYYGAKETFGSFIGQYEEVGREIKEQVLNLNGLEQRAVLNAIAFSLTEENKRYHYDFLYNNCSTKLRDMLDSSLNNQLQYGQVIAADSLKYMHDLNSYLQNKHWDRIGIDVLLSSEVNKKINTYGYMYLPEALYKGLNKTTKLGKPLVSESISILPNKQSNIATFNTPRWLFAGIAMLFLLGTIFKPNSITLKIADTLFFTCLGLLGCLFLFMWLGTNHLQTKHNLNLLWCLPTHLAIAYFIFSRKNQKFYFQISFVLTCLAAVLAIFYSTAWEIYPLIIVAAMRLFYRFRNTNDATNN